MLFGLAAADPGGIKLTPARRRDRMRAALGGSIWNRWPLLCDQLVTLVLGSRGEHQFRRCPVLMQLLAEDRGCRTLFTLRAERPVFRGAHA